MAPAASPPTAGAPSGGARPRAAARQPVWARLSDLAALLVPGLLLLALGGRRLWITDDAFISFRVARNLLSGQGPVFNIGERVEVYSHPLWLGLLAAAEGLTGQLEVTAAGLGLGLSALGLTFGLLASATLARPGSGVGQARIVPLGSWLVLALPPFWDFASSGLETGLAFCWLGGSGLLLARHHAARRPSPPLTAMALAGLGPLIRPDFVVLSAGLLALGLAGGRPRERPARAAAALLLASSPALAYQIFRMGYFAALLPNTALAKSATGVNWGQGWIYWRDLAAPYHLTLPLALILLTLALTGPGGQAAGARRRLAWGMALIAGLYGLLVIRAGGGYMHGRLLLPALFCLQLPAACVPIGPWRSPRSWLLVSLALAMTGWAGWCALAGRVPYRGVGPEGIADERDFYVTESRRPHPISVADMGHAQARGMSLPRWRREAAAAAAVPLADRHTIDQSGGAFAYGYGPAGYCWVGAGLSDPVGSRLALPARGRPGHEKELPPTWKHARFHRFVPDELDAAGFARWRQRTAVEREAARRALGCPPLSSLLAAIQGPLTARRFARNLVLAWRTRALTIPARPAAAARALCGGGPR